MGYSKKQDRKTDLGEKGKPAERIWLASLLWGPPFVWKPKFHFCVITVKRCDLLQEKADGSGPAGRGVGVGVGVGGAPVAARHTSPQPTVNAPGTTRLYP